MATWPKEEDIVRAISNGGIKFKEQEQSLSISRVRQFGLYPMWTQGNLREFAPSKKLLLYVEIHNDNVANNGGTFACLQFENYITIGPFVV